MIDPCQDTMIETCHECGRVAVICCDGVFGQKWCPRCCPNHRLNLKPSLARIFGLTLIELCIVVFSAMVLGAIIGDVVVAVVRRVS